MDEAHQDRVARNEAFFRDVNRRIEDTAIRFDRADDDEHVYEMICECATSDCHEMIRLSLGAYKHIRAEGARFAVRPDHVFPRAEVVVERHDGYWTVEKIEHGRRISELLDQGTRIPGER